MTARAAQTLGQPDANALLERARQLAPESYAAARAADLRGAAASGQLDPATPLGAADWQTIAAWAGVSAADLSSEPGLTRADLLTAAGLSAEAAGEFAALLEQWRQDPARLLALARFATERGAPEVAIDAADALLALAPAERAAAPLALTRLRYPVPYLAAVLASGADPALYYGLLRQESRFTAGAISSVGALGVAQVMPETGTSIAAGAGRGSVCARRPAAPGGGRAVRRAVSARPDRRCGGQPAGGAGGLQRRPGKRRALAGTG